MVDATKKPYGPSKMYGLMVGALNTKRGVLQMVLLAVNSDLKDSTTDSVKQWVKTQLEHRGLDINKVKRYIADNANDAQAVGESLGALMIGCSNMLHRFPLHQGLY